MSLIPSDFPKPDLFLFHNNLGDTDVTNYNIDDLLNLSIELDDNLQIACLYENSNLNSPIVSKILFKLDNSDNNVLSTESIFDGLVATQQVNYNNKVYYFYYQQQIG